MTDLTKISINGEVIEVDGAMTLIQACEMAGVEIPRFCYHERLSIAGNCRMCLVEVVGGPPKPAASCAIHSPVSPQLLALRLRSTLVQAPSLLSRAEIAALSDSPPWVRPPPVPARSSPLSSRAEAWCATKGRAAETQSDAPPRAPRATPVARPQSM